MSDPTSICLRNPPALRRLLALCKLDGAAVAALEKAIESSTMHRAHSELVREGQPAGTGLLIVKGWAAHLLYLPDGRRQIIRLLLPGDVIDISRYDRELASSTVLTLTDVKTCHAPRADLSPSLARAYAIDCAIERSCLVAQIMRLGRLHALEKLSDLLLEVHERLSMAGEVQADSFDFPLTQEVLSDVLGLTAVHVNRTLQQMRHADLIDWSAKRLTIKSVAALSEFAGRKPLRVRAL